MYIFQSNIRYQTINLYEIECIIELISYKLQVLIFHIKPSVDLSTARNRHITYNEELILETEQWNADFALMPAGDTAHPPARVKLSCNFASDRL